MARLPLMRRSLAGEVAGTARGLWERPGSIRPAGSHLDPSAAGAIAGGLRWLARTVVASLLVAAVLIGGRTRFALVTIPATLAPNATGAFADEQDPSATRASDITLDTLDASLANGKCGPHERDHQSGRARSRPMHVAPCIAAYGAAECSAQGSGAERPRPCGHSD